MAKKISNEVLIILDRCVTDGQQLRLPGQKLDRPLYVAVNKVLEAAGGKWNKKLGAHLFPHDAANAMEQIVLTGEVRDIRQELQQFFTPTALAARVVDMADIHYGHDVMEPSAGGGALAFAADMKAKTITCVELDEALYARLASHKGMAWEVRHADFLETKIQPVFDRVVMNPPFSKFADIKHVLHAVKFLRPDGRLVSIMSSGTIEREAKIAREFRDFVARVGGSFEMLPDDSFRESGTSVSTCVVTIPYTED
jgi:predicted RNA methylase